MDGNDATNRMKTLKCTKYNKKTTLQNDLNYAHYNDTGNMLNLSGLLIFCAVAEPRNCGMHYMVAHHIVVQHKLNEHCAQRFVSNKHFSKLLLFCTY